MSFEVRSRNYSMDYSMNEGYSSDEEHIEPAVRVDEAIQGVRGNWDYPASTYCAGVRGAAFAAISQNGAFVPGGAAAGSLVGLAILKVRAQLEENR